MNHIMNHLHVMYASDEKYAPFLGVSVFSLLENNRDIEEITIYTVLDDVSQENRDRLSRMVESYGRKLIVVDANKFNITMQELGVPKYRGSYTTHFRKFFHLFMGEDAKRFLYIDSDTIVPGSLKPLLELDMGEACGAVVLDALGNKYKLLLGFRPDETYFNAGVTLIDVDNWKKNHCTERLIEHITKERAAYCNPDQDLFNILLRGKTMVIPCRYNFMPVHRAYSDKAYAKNYGFDNYYTKDEIDYARLHPAIIHAYRFLGEFPWHKGSLHPDVPLFDEYLCKSPWSDYEKRPSNTNYIYICERMLYRILPRDWFLTLFRVITDRSTYLKEIKLRKNNRSLKQTKRAI